MAQEELLELKLADLQREEEKRLEMADVICRRVYAKRVLRALRRMTLQRQTEADVEAILTGDKPLEDLLGHRDGQWEGVIRNACTEYQGLKDLAFLLLVAPKASGDIGVEHDNQAREIQLDHFYKMFVRDKELGKFPRDVQTVKTYRCLEGHLDNFMEIYASKSKRAMIVFNGHGKDSGHLSLVSETKDISNTRFLKDIYKSWNRFKEKHHSDADDEMILPTRVTVVLAHCYGYKHTLDEEYRGAIEVACLTSKHRPETKYVYKFNTLKNRIKASLHLDLINFAREEVHKDRDSVSSPEGSPAHQFPPSPDAIQNVETSEAMAPMAFMALCDQNLSSAELQSAQLSVTQRRLGEYHRMDSAEKGGTRALLAALAPLNIGSEFSVPDQTQSRQTPCNHRQKSTPRMAGERPETQEQTSATGALMNTGHMLAGTALGLDSMNNNKTPPDGLTSKPAITGKRTVCALVGASLGASRVKQEKSKSGKEPKAKKTEKKSSVTALLACSANLAIGMTGQETPRQSDVTRSSCECQQRGKCTTCRSAKKTGKR